MVDHSPALHRVLFDSLSKELNIHQLEDWYGFQKADVFSLSVPYSPSPTISTTTTTTNTTTPTASVPMVTVLSKHYQGSLIQALQTVYPEYHWQVWQFKQVPDYYWQNEGNAREYLEWLSDEFQMERYQDWYQVHVKHQIPFSLISYHGGFAALMDYYFPEFPWIPLDASTASSSYPAASAATTTTAIPSQQYNNNNNNTNNNSSRHSKLQFVGYKMIRSLFPGEKQQQH